MTSISVYEEMQAKRRSLFKLGAHMHGEFAITFEQESRFLAALAGADLKACCALVGEVERGDEA